MHSQMIKTCFVLSSANVILAALAKISCLLQGLKCTVRMQVCYVFV